MTPPRRLVLPVLAIALGAGCVGTEVAKVIASRDAIGAARDDYPCPSRNVRVLSTTADVNVRHWLYIIDICGVPHAYRDRNTTGGFDFVEVPMPADAGPPPLVLPPRAPEESDGTPRPCELDASCAGR